MMSMRAFQTCVGDYADRSNGLPIYNDSINHASIIIEELFRQAKRSIKIISGNLNTQAYGQKDIVVEALDSLSRGGLTIQILLEIRLSEEEYETHPLLTRIRKSRKCEIRTVPEHLSKLYSYHFLLVDDESYRFEGNKESIQAVAVFGDEPGASNLSQNFDDIWKMSNPARTEITSSNRYEVS